MMPIDTTKMTELYYEQILYNEVIFHLEQEWGRKLDGHERHILIKGYKFGRQVEATCELKILIHKRQK